MASSKTSQGLTGLSSESGRVASLHVHPERAGDPLLILDILTLVEERGIREEIRYFNRKSKATGLPSKRQVSLIEREQIQAHSGDFRIPMIAPGVVRSNIETHGINLLGLVGCEVEIGEAVLFVYEPRTPCPKMEHIHPGLQENMKNGRQGVLAQVRKSGIVRIGDKIRKMPPL